MMRMQVDKREKIPSLRRGAGMTNAPRATPAALARSSRNFHYRRGDLPARILHKADHALKCASIRASQGRHRGRERMVEQRHHTRMKYYTCVRWGSRATSCRGFTDSPCRWRALAHTTSNVSRGQGDSGKGRRRRRGHEVCRSIDETVAKRGDVFGRAAQNGLDDLVAHPVHALVESPPLLSRPSLLLLSRPSL